MRNLLASLALVLFVPFAFADQLDDGDYTYNDQNGSQDAIVTNGGLTLTLDDGVEQHVYNYNAILDTYQELGGTPVEPGNSITWEEQTYRYIGVNADTGVCTLYED